MRPDWLNMPDWLRFHETTLWWMGAVSMLTFIGTLIIIPLIVVRIPTNYFTRKHRQHSLREDLSISRLLMRIAKNIAGIIFIIAGIAMLVLPGQGILTILLGIMLTNFPGKYTFERYIVRQPNVLKALNWIRTRANRPPLLVTQPDAATSTDHTPS